MVEFWAHKLWSQLRSLAVATFHLRFGQGDAARIKLHSETVAYQIGKIRAHGIVWHRVARFCGLVDQAALTAFYENPSRFGEEPPEEGTGLREQWNEEERDLLMRILLPPQPVKYHHDKPSQPSRKKKGRRR